MMASAHAPGSGDLRYYLDVWSDEVVPCDCTLEGWAEWLSKPDDCWCRDEAAKDGETFQATVLRFDDDIVARYDFNRDAVGEWTFSREVHEAALIAVRFASGLGWDAESIVDGMQGLREFLEENPEQFDRTEYVAVAYDEPAVRLTYRTDPPRLIVEGSVQ